MVKKVHFYFSVESRIAPIINFGLCYHHNSYEDKSAGRTYVAFKQVQILTFLNFLCFEAFYASLRLVHTQASNYLAR